MAIIRRVGVLSLGKIYSLLLLVVGFLEGVAIAITTATGSVVSDSSYPFMQLGYAAIIVMPILYAILGFIVGCIGALLYNAFAKMVGGVDVELEASPSSTAVITPMAATSRKRK
jgi:hypothetical protein